MCTVAGVTLAAISGQVEKPRWRMHQAIDLRRFLVDLTIVGPESALADRIAGNCTVQDADPIPRSAGEGNRTACGHSNSSANLPHHPALRPIALTLCMWFISSGLIQVKVGIDVGQGWPYNVAGAVGFRLAARTMTRAWLGRAAVPGTARRVCNRIDGKSPMGWSREGLRRLRCREGAET